MAKIELISCDSGDWEVLKVNGEVYNDGHSTPVHVWINLLSELGNAITTKTISDENMKNGEY